MYVDFQPVFLPSHINIESILFDSYFKRARRTHEWKIIERKELALVYANYATK